MKDLVNADIEWVNQPRNEELEGRSKHFYSTLMKARGAIGGFLQTGMPPPNPFDVPQKMWNEISIVLGPQDLPPGVMPKDMDKPVTRTIDGVIHNGDWNLNMEAYQIGAMSGKPVDPWQKPYFDDRSAKEVKDTVGNTIHTQNMQAAMERDIANSGYVDPSNSDFGTNKPLDEF